MVNSKTIEAVFLHRLADTYCSLMIAVKAWYVLPHLVLNHDLLHVIVNDSLEIRRLESGNSFGLFIELGRWGCE